MTRIIEHRKDASVGEEVFELRVFKLGNGEVRACVLPIDLPVNHNMIDDLSKPVAQAFLDGLALCEKEDIPILWVHDPFSIFPPRGRPVQEM